MAERSRRVRRQISDVTEDSPEGSDAESEDFDPRKADSARRAGRQEVPSSPASRSKRGTATTISSIGGSNGEGKQSIKLTMKVAPSKLREVMRANEVDSLRDTLGGGQVLDGPRSSRRVTHARATGRGAARPKYVEPQESELEEEEEEEEEDEEGEEDDEDDDGEAEEDATMNDFDEVGAEAEGGTDDEDVEMDDDDSPAPPPPRRGPVPPKPPKITLKTPAKKAVNTKMPPKPALIVTPADVGPVRSVEDEEMDDDSEDEDDEDDEIDENSELPDNEETNLDEEDAEGEDDQDETNLNEEDAEGEDEELEDDEEDDDELGDSDDDEPGSGTATPDPSKMTSRQRGRPVEPLLALDMAPQQRKFFTDEEKAMKKDEHARKRKELTKRKTQEEKTAALNRLLKPQVSKTRGAAPKAETLAAQMQAAAEEEEIEIKADPMFTRWISTKEGVRLGVPDEWLGKNVGRYFGPPLPPSSGNGRMVQEVE